MDTFDFPHFPIWISDTWFCEGTNGKVCGLRKMGEMGLDNMGISSHFSPGFLSITPPVFRHFSATCRGCSYDFYCDLMRIPISPHFLPFAPIFPQFFIFHIFPRRLRGLGDLGFGYLGALSLNAKSLTQFSLRASSLKRFSLHNRDAACPRSWRACPSSWACLCPCPCPCPSTRPCPGCCPCPCLCQHPCPSPGPAPCPCTRRHL